MAGVVIERDDPPGAEAEVLGHQRQPLGLAQRELAAGGLDEPQARAQLAGAPPEAGARLVEADAVVVARVLAVVQHAIHPLARVGALPGQRHAIDLGRRQARLAQAGVDGQPRIAGVVLEAREALFGGAGDDRAVAQDGGGRAVGLGDAEDDHRSILTDPYGQTCT